jgi:tRNA pseudouridine13 synthase
MTSPQMPHLSAGLPGTGGIARERLEDFVVEEIPAYAPSGGGEHTWLFVEKTGISTIEAVRRLARALGVREGDFGYAGHKDARGITRQWLSVTRVEPKRAWTTAAPGLKILDVSRHGNRLKIGHLAGNRFEITLRGVVGDAEARAKKIVALLARRGVPNWFGEQRFGARDDSDLVGRELVRGSAEGAMKLLLGSPRPEDAEEQRRARELFDAGRLEEALRAWPGRNHSEREALARLARGATAEQALAAWTKRLRFLFVSACQSRLFNAVLAARLDRLDRVETGDLAFLHRNGAVFKVEDAAREQPRAERFEISPSGPLFGYKVPAAEGRPGEAEALVLAGSGLKLDDFKNPLALKARGERRALRVPLGEPSVRAFEADGRRALELKFSLPAGSFATAVLGEVMKTGD